MKTLPRPLLGALPFQGAARPGAEPLADDLIDSRIEVHDSTHIEVKLDYGLDLKRRRNRYRVEMFMFMPMSLGMAPDTYGKKQFYRDIQAYIRLKTPGLALGDLLDPAGEDSPLARLERELPAAGADAAAHRALAADMRMVGCLLRSHVRDQVRRACDLLAAVPGEGEAFTRETLALVRDAEAVLARFRALRVGDAPALLRETHVFVDEYMSVSSENFLTRLLLEMDGREDARPILREARSVLADLVGAEQRYRAEKGLLTLEPGRESFYVYRRGQLKKFVMGVLFLEITRSEEGHRLLDLFAAIAAGVSMAIATLGSIWAQQRFLSSTWPFLAAVVLIYMVKDRTKEWLRTYFFRRMTGALADWSERIVDPQGGRVLGRCREAFGFLPLSAVPPEVTALRHRQARSVLEAAGKPEVVFKYEKEITLDASAIRRLGDLPQEINDILRFNLTRFMARADDPETAVIAYDPGSDAVEKRICPKVYHLNAVMVLRAEDGRPPSREHVRIILDKRGILGLEHFPEQA